jgi:hypothetical protein
MQVSSGTQFFSTRQERIDFTRCRDAVKEYIKVNPPSSFPKFKDAAHRAGTVSRSHAMRSGFEHAGDTFLYQVVDWALQEICPGEFVHFKVRNVLR